VSVGKPFSDELATDGTSVDDFFGCHFSQEGSFRSRFVTLTGGVDGTTCEHSAHKMHVGVGLTRTTAGETFWLTVNTKRWEYRSASLPQHIESTVCGLLSIGRRLILTLVPAQLQGFSSPFDRLALRLSVPYFVLDAMPCVMYNNWHGQETQPFKIAGH
jgi:hypothetical protein